MYAVRAMQFSTGRPVPQSPAITGNEPGSIGGLYRAAAGTRSCQSVSR